VAYKKKPRDITIDKPLVDAFQNKWPGFKDEPIETQVSLIHVLRRAYIKRRAHSENEDAFYMTWQELEREFGRGGFNEVNERLKLFHILARGSPVRGVTNQYLLNDIADQIYAKVRKKKPRGQLTKIFDGLGRVWRTLPNALASKDVEGVTVEFWHDEPIPSSVPINVQAFDTFTEQLENKLNQHDLFVNADKKKINDALHYIREIRTGAHHELIGRGNVAHHYRESRTGRLTADGYNLQGAPRSVRRSALVGLWDYDFENCHYAIIQQMAKRDIIKIMSVKN